LHVGGCPVSSLCASKDPKGIERRRRRKGLYPRGNGKPDGEMVKKVVWSNESDEDLDSIAEYIAKDSEFYASSFVQEILDTGNSLEMFPERGRIVPEIGYNNIRELFIKEYRLIYCIEVDRILILSIVHGKRDLKKLWETKKSE
jgi:toxin ParE1/3/4